MADIVPQIQNDLSTGVISTVETIPGLTQVQKNALNTAAVDLSAQYAPEMVNQVSTNANGQITSLSDNATGPNNPLDIVNGNLSSSNTNC